MEAKRIVQQAEEAGVQLVNFLFCDNAGIIRGKATHVSGLERRLESGIGLTKAMPAMSGMDQLQVVDGFGPVGEVRLIPDLDTFTILPYAPTRALALADMITIERQPWGACPRSFLKRMIEKARSMGIAFQAAMEPEWYLAREEDGEFVPMDESLDNASIGLTASQPVIDDVVAALTAQGLQVEQYYPELGHGQQEMSITHAEALRAADNHIIYRETVRNVAWQHGWLASFAPKPFPHLAGNGCHTHLSAWDLNDEVNLFYDPDDGFADQRNGVSLHRRHTGTSTGAHGARRPQHEQLPANIARLMEHRFHLLRPPTTGKPPCESPPAFGGLRWLLRTWSLGPPIPAPTPTFCWAA